MKYFFKKLAFLALVVVFSLNFQACKTGEGCGLQEKYGAPTNKDGELSTKKGGSTLFSKKQSKRMKKRS